MEPTSQEPRSSRSVTAVLVVLALALAVRLTACFALPEMRFPDSATYDDLARSIRERLTLEDRYGIKAAVAPGYPVFIAGCRALLGSSKFAYSAMYPLLTAFNSVPKAALVPILVVWFGIGAGPAILTAFLISFFPIMVNIATGLATLEPELEDVLRVLGARRLDVLLNQGNAVDTPDDLESASRSLAAARQVVKDFLVICEVEAGTMEPDKQDVGRVSLVDRE